MSFYGIYITASVQAIILPNEFENRTSKITATSPRDQWNNTNGDASNSIKESTTHRTRYVKCRVTCASGMPGTFFPPPRVSDPDMHHSTGVTHVPWCMPGSLTNGFLWNRWQEKIPGIPGACASPNFAYLVRGPCTLIAHTNCYCVIARWYQSIRFAPIRIGVLTHDKKVRWLLFLPNSL